MFPDLQTYTHTANYIGVRQKVKVYDLPKVL